MHLLGAFPDKCLVAENIKERILAQAYDPLDKEVSFHKPKTILSAIEKGFLTRIESRNTSASAAGERISRL
jgi:hypothetical protein